MEGKKQLGSSSSSSSLTSELFGFKESPPPSPSSTGIFGSIFAPSPKVVGRESGRSEMVGDTKNGNSDAMSNEGGSHSAGTRDVNSIYQEQRVQPCDLSSSIYYGGQDIYNHPQNNQDSNTNSVFKKDGTEDDSGGASRGNWWQGSLYY